MRKIVFTLIVVLVASGLSAAPSFAVATPPELTAATAILIDAKTGDVLYKMDEDVLKEPASTTKIVTCLLALENLDLNGVITIDAASPLTGGSKINVVEGEEFTVRQLLYALMLDSANDAATALAIAMAGSVDDFAIMMNGRAREAGATRPSYKNPHGLHAEGHFASAYDLAMVAMDAMKNPEFREIVSTASYLLPATNKREERGYIYNTNKLLADEESRVSVKGVMTPTKYEGATGVKTGSTPQAGGTLVASAERGGTELIAVVLASTESDRFGDCIALLDFGFENYYTYKAVAADMEIEDARVRKGAVNRVGVKVSEERYVSLPTEASPSLISTIAVMDDGIVTAPITEGQQLGKIEIFEDNNLIGEVALVAVADVPEGRFLSRFGIEDSVSAVVVKTAGAMAGTALLLVIAYLILRIRYEKRRKARRMNRAIEIVMERQRKQRDRSNRKWPY